MDRILTKHVKKRKTVKGQIEPGPVLDSGTGTSKATRTNTGQPVRQRLNTYFHAAQVPFPLLPREALQNEGHGSTLPLSNFLMK